MPRNCGTSMTVCSHSAKHSKDLSLVASWNKRVMTTNNCVPKHLAMFSVRRGAIHAIRRLVPEGFTLATPEAACVATAGLCETRVCQSALDEGGGGTSLESTTPVGASSGGGTVGLVSPSCLTAKASSSFSGSFLYSQQCAIMCPEDAK